MAGARALEKSRQCPQKLRLELHRQSVLSNPSWNRLKFESPTSRRDAFGDVRDKSLVYVLLYELLLGPYKSIRGGGAVKRKVLKHEASLRRCLAKVCEESDDVTRRVIRACVHGDGHVDDVSDNSPTVPTRLWPKYVRVNTFKTTLKEAADEARARFGEGRVALHKCIDNLLVLPHDAKKLHEWDMVTSGSLVIQDLSSCLPAAATRPASNPDSSTSRRR